MEDNANLRAVLIDWTVAVHLQIRLMAETFQVAVVITASRIVHNELLGLSFCECYGDFGIG
uniref:Uncharacterized protein n=1 Tax=Glossina pallidipes TaxID=7398 RepID=A0A1A9ZP65_GLOPL